MQFLGDSPGVRNERSNQADVAFHGLDHVVEPACKHLLGETQCIAYCGTERHVCQQGKCVGGNAQERKRTLFIASLRYLDVFLKTSGKWLFAERKLLVDWTDTRAMSS